MLWRAVRAVLLWANTPEEDREGLFVAPSEDMRSAVGQVCGLAPDLIEALGTFILLRRAPHRMDGPRLAEACQQVYEWADSQGQLLTAACFAEAAAIADLQSPATANTAARMCRRAAQEDRATSWYLRAFRLAVQADDRTESVRALLGYGGLMYNLGRHSEARLYYERAARRAARTGRRRQAAEAKHDLLLIAAEVGSYWEGERHACKALRLYPVHHPRIPHFVHDVAFLLIQNRYYTHALPLLRRVLPLITQPAEQVLVWSSIARAAGGSGQIHLYTDAADRAERSVRRFEEHAPAALRNLAEGAWARNQWEQAEVFARRAVETARGRRESEPERRALALLDKLAARECAPQEAEPPERNRIGELTRGCILRLQKWKAPDRSGSEADANAAD